MYSQTFTFVNIYLPNSNALPTPEAFLSTLVYILEGDFNLTLHCRRDFFSNFSSLPWGTRLHLKDLLHTYQLVDIWRIFHLQERDYTFYSNVHCYSNHLFFLKHLTIPLVTKTDIGHITLSDYTPIILELVLSQAFPNLLCGVLTRRS